ncbi:MULTISPECIES: zeta toxin family protein [Flavobacterium]|uniref:zeta toxin family protein n=1 Tax=Flavobacterium TaxID=237 RepID=UPI002113E0AE|nr:MULTISPECIES: zeta toxin family protein [Flavobacterium]UUF15508.1 zeta toxin family protein [Flavobacterium panici]
MQEIKKRLRVFAGPNGSGKSTLFEEFSKNYNTGYFINADYLEKILKTKGLIDLDFYDIKASKEELENFFKKPNTKTLIETAQEKGFQISLEIKENFIISLSKNPNSYEGSLISSFLREKLIKENKSFCFETVMSHVSKLEDIKEANSLGYTSYLYFVCIDDPEINISRVENRVQKGGHYVDSEIIKNRYNRTLNNLFPAIEISNKAYLFDNSTEKLTLIAEINEGKSLKLHINEEDFPNWFREFVLNHFI